MSTSTDAKHELMEKIVSLCKRRGFVFPGSEIYGGFAGTYDLGPLGVALRRNVVNLWLTMFVHDRRDMYEMDAALIMNPKVWEASGHVAGFSDPMTDGTRFNVMFKTEVGAGKENVASYLRPETAQGMFTNFKNVMDSVHTKLPFGLAQIGKAFRNEIAPRDFLFRAREFEQMEIEYFFREQDWEKQFEHWRGEMWKWIDALGLSRGHVHELEVPDGERAHYSKRTIDFEYDFPFGRKELYGLAYRTDFDLENHSQFSGTDLSYYDEETKERFVPHVVEPTFGLGRTILALLVEHYAEDELSGLASAEASAGKEKRVFLKLPPLLAPVKIAVFPLLKNKPELVSKANDVYQLLKSGFNSGVVFDDNGNIGKRYRRQDEIGTPFCITIDFDTLTDEAVTLRDRDTGKQERVKIGELTELLKSKI